MNLSNLNIGDFAQIVSIEINGDIKKRLLDLGIVPGTKIRAVLSSGNKENVAYMVRRTLISIRKEDAKKIRVKFI